MLTSNFKIMNQKNTSLTGLPVVVPKSQGMVNRIFMLYFESHCTLAAAESSPGTLNSEQRELSRDFCAPSKNKSSIMKPDYFSCWNSYIQLNEYETTPYFIQFSQNLTCYCLLISVFCPKFTWAEPKIVLFWCSKQF